MSNANHETIADIVADIRAQNQGLPEDSYALSPLVCDLLSLADRIEAAAKREREAGAEAAQVCGEIGEMIGREATREKSSRVGNAAKMRDALNGTQSVIAKCMEILNSIPGGVPYDGLIDDVADELCDLRDSHVKPALAATPRNCDIGTALEQVSRHRIWCKCGGGCAVSCKMCFAKWSQMPYEEGGAK